MSEQTIDQLKAEVAEIRADNVRLRAIVDELAPLAIHVDDDPSYDPTWEHGCFTGDCPHGDQAECWKAVRSWVLERERAWLAKWRAAADENSKNFEQVNRLREFVEKLPKTADGVRYDELRGCPPHSEPTAFWPHAGKVYEVRDWKFNWERRLLGVPQGYPGVYGIARPCIEECYSTREAAAAAMERAP